MTSSAPAITPGPLCLISTPPIPMSTNITRNVGYLHSLHGISPYTLRWDLYRTGRKSLIPRTIQ
jgi:hypothetical protein